MKEVFVFLATGFEEVEAITPIDYLRRAGFDVVIVGVTGKTVSSSRGVTVLCDTTVQELEAESPLMAVLPGGLPNAEILADSDAVRDIVLEVNKTGGIVGAICATPALALSKWGLLEGREFTCYPKMDADLPKKASADKRVVRDGNIITACAAGAAEEFAFALIEAVAGKTGLKKVKDAVLAR
ncbi:MAG: DJ-1 family protein [Treponema sp.]|nr:MAG: DJ-1 family protein [Treponema sp.]